MGMWDRWRRARAESENAIDALAEDMTRHGVIIITREDSSYVVYWARRQEELHSSTAGEVLKRSVEGRGATVLEGMLACRAKAVQ